MKLTIRTINPMLSPQKKPVGLGDVVSAVAKPIARIFDAAFNTELANCKTCDERGRKLNARVADITHPFK